MSAEEYAKGRYGGVSNDPSNSSYQLGQAERIAYNPGNYYAPRAPSYDFPAAARPGSRVRLPRWFVRAVVIGVVGYFAVTGIRDAWLDGAGTSAFLWGMPALGIAIAAHAYKRVQDAFEYLCLSIFWIWAGLTALQVSGFSL
jgi:hypothetical protein